MPKALIIGPDFYNFNEAVRAAFASAGYETQVLKYGTPVDPYDSFSRIAYKLTRDKEAARLRNRRHRQIHYAAAFDAFDPDLVFILNGEILCTDTLDFFRKRARTALWCFDSVRHIPVVQDHIDHVDRFYCYDRSDIEFYRKSGREALFLPQAADTCIYHPLEGVKKDIDILFVGDLYHSPRRQRYVQEVIRAFPGKTVKVAGIYKPWYKGLKAALCDVDRRVFTNRNLPPEKVNELYNRARVVLNIHNEQQKDGANPKVFEICAAGAYQVCDANPYIRQLFPDGEIGLYETPEQMISCLGKALDGDMAQVAAAARKKVLAGHTFDARIAQVIQDINR